MQISSAGLALIKSFEGCKLAAYKDQRGIWTIGWGCANEFVHRGLTWTQAQADSNLLQDVSSAERAVTDLVKVPLSQCQFDALVSFTFNLGSGALQRSTLLRLLNAGQYEQAADQFPLFDHVLGRIDPGLTRRRDAERQLFLHEAITV